MTCVPGVPPLLASRSGVLTQANTADPAAAAEFTQTVPDGEYWVLLAVSVNFATDGTGTPWPSLTVTDGTDIVYRSLSGTAGQAISLTCRHTWAPGLDLAGAASDAAKTGSLPSGLVLGPGYVIASSTASIAGTDNYGAASLLYVRYAL